MQIVAACCLVAAWAQQQQQYTTPIPILKQINRQNEDGSYSYGYEGADGSYKIETKHPTGEVYGKYGYVDDSGALREIEYGANKLGFQPAGTGINVAPPTLPDPNNNYVGPDGVDDGQYREDPSVYWKDPKYNQGAPKYSAPAPTRQPIYTQASAQTYSRPSQQRYTQPAQETYSQPAQQTYSQPAQQTYSQPSRSFSPSFSQSFNQPSYSQPPYNQPSYSQPSYSQPAQRSSWARSWEPAAPVAPVDYSAFSGHPATNFDVSSGSYSINYK